MNLRNYRKWSWPLNALIYNVCRLVPCRDKRVWVFGESSGLYYSDSPRYLYEYINGQKADGVRCIWLTHSPQIIQNLEKNGTEVYPINSIKAVLWSLRCGVAVYNKSLDDLGIFPLVGGAKIITPWHGAGFKRIHNALLSGKKLRLKRFLDYIFSWKTMDMLFATSEYNKQQFYEWFTIKRENIIITGIPRNDVLLKGCDRETLLKSLGILPQKKIILYMPTHRPMVNGENIVGNIVKELSEDEELSDFVKSQGYEFVIKLHPLTHIDDLDLPENFHLLSYGEVQNSQELLSLADILITDYSSCFIDYALLERPIILYVPDEKNYMQNTGGVYKEFYNILRLCRADNPKQLIKRLEKPDLAATNVTNDYYRSPSDKGNYCRNAYLAMKEFVGI